MTLTHVFLTVQLHASFSYVPVMRSQNVHVHTNANAYTTLNVVFACIHDVVNKLHTCIALSAVVPSFPESPN